MKTSVRLKQFWRTITMGLLPVSVALAKEAYDNRYRADIPRGVRKLCSGGNLARRSGRLAKPSYGVSPSTSIFDPAVRSFSNFSRSLIFRSAERSKLLLTVVAILFLLAFPAARESRAQSPISPPGSGLTLRFGSELPADVATIYERGLVYLAGAQQADGSWQGMGNPGVTGICLMAFLASGDDPNFGRYHSNVRAAVRSLILTQDPDTGYFGNSMYHHGFAMLALAEVYGAFDESRLWDGSEDAKRKRTIIDAIDLAVRSAVTSQKKNQWGGWRYSPDSNDADTSVTGAVLMGLLAARNAGIEVSDESVETALGYFQKSTSEAGMVAYSGFGGMGESMNRSSIAALVYSIGKKRDWDEFDSTVKYISSHLEHQEQSHPNYFSYYMAQALFQGNFEAWEKWNRQIIRQLKDLQQSDGSFVGSQGPEYGTGMSLLAVALNYRFLPIYER